MRAVLFSLLSLLFITFTSCEFSETMTLNADGSGEMRVQLDASSMIEMMAAMGEQEEMAGMDERVDTTFFIKDMLKEKGDSIAKLSLEQQASLKKLEPYGVHVTMDATEQKAFYDVFINFNDITEANNIFDVFNEIGDTGVGASSSTETSVSQESIKVNYSFENDVFKRNAFIADPELYKSELDSLEGMEMMLSGTLYKIKYSFPKKIKSSTQPQATFSLDGKTISFQAEYIEYIKNPDLLDIEVVLED